VTLRRGLAAEACAAAWLERQGLQVVARNWRCRFGGAAASNDARKQRKLVAAAGLYLASSRNAASPAAPTPCS